MIARGRTSAELRECSAPQLALLAELHERAHVRGLLDQLMVIGAGTGGGDAARAVWRHLEGRLHDAGSADAEPLQPRCNTPLSTDDFAKMLEESGTG